MSAGECVLTEAAPTFTATAVVNGDFKDISLSDYQGNACIITTSFETVCQ